uniref:Putative ovule protein n=1 Tax=Solanum chacoense TaxID=4108 RepID=A0A0V0H7K8_SOLCH
MKRIQAGNSKSSWEQRDHLNSRGTCIRDNKLTKYAQIHIIITREGEPALTMKQSALEGFLSLSSLSF